MVEIEVTVAVKLAELAPAPTSTLPGTAALALLLDNATLSPPLGAAPVNVTVQAALPGEFTLDGLQLTPLGVTDAARLIAAFALTPLNDAVTAAVWPLVTVPAVTVKLALLAPPATVTLPGTGSTLVLLDNVTTIEATAALFKLAVQVVLWPDPTVLGAQLTDEICAGDTIPSE